MLGPPEVVEVGRSRAPSVASARAAVARDQRDPSGERRRTIDWRWARFLSAYIPDGYLPVLVGVAMAWSHNAGGEFWVRAALLLIAAVAVSLFVHGSDNITGYLHGVDKLSAARKAAQNEPKLLVTGDVGVREAVVAMGGLFVLTFAIAIYFVFTSHWVATVLGTVVLGVTAQYSVGVRFSYRGLGEVVILVTGLGTPLAYILLRHRVDGASFLIGMMLGLFFVAVNVNSNYADYPYDRDAGRRTLAVRIGLDWQRRLAVGVACAAWIAFIAGVVLGALPVHAMIGIGLVPRQLRQLRALFRGDALEARRIGFGTLRRLCAIVAIAFALQRAFE